MKCPSLFFAGLTGIDLPNSAAPGISLRGSIMGTTDKPFISRMICSYERSIGSVEVSFLQHLAKAVAFSRSEVDLDPNHAPEAINGRLIQYLAELRAWLHTLWLVKDNAVDVDYGWMVARVNGQDIVNNNRWSSAPCKADGSFDIIAFSRLELSDAASIPLGYAHWNEGRPIDLSMAVARDPAVTKLSANSLRFQRFMYFVDAARCSRDVALKIANYCSGLEAIVSSSQSELSHQVAERTACLLHPLGAERLSAFQFIKAAYGLRSKAVHGAPFKSKDNLLLQETSVSIDSICRRIAQAYLIDDSFRTSVEADEKTFNQFWLDRIFVSLSEQ